MPEAGCGPDGRQRGGAPATDVASTSGVAATARPGRRAVDPQEGLAAEGRREVPPVQPRDRRATRPAVPAALGVQCRGGQQRGAGAGNGHVLGRQPGRQVAGGAADREHLPPGRERVVAVLSGNRAQRRPRLGQQRWP